ncbi:MAG: DUF86 domain-containing protein [Acidobacteria bacterium]|nr:DUF86 domain-containing protein [Acidobacteriota bacterium]
MRLIAYVSSTSWRPAASEELRQQAPDVPWANIVAMRNRLIHAYFDVNLGFVWSTVTQDLPDLILALERVLNQIESETA